MSILIKLKDGGIEDIDTGEWGEGGCRTCDFGTIYVNEMQFELTNYTLYATFRLQNQISASYLIKLFINEAIELESISEKDFAKWLKRRIKKDIGFTKKDFINTDYYSK